MSNMKQNDVKQRLKTESEFVEKLKQQIIGYSPKIQTIIGELCGVYCDHTATARPFKMIEDHILHDIKPMIANSHTETSATGNFSTQLMNYAEESLLNSFKVNKKTHFAVPAGYGATGAFERMIKILNFDSIQKLEKQQKTQNLLTPVVYITPYEHHSNILPWVQIGCKVIVIDSDRFGNINYEMLQQQLQINKKYKYQIVSFSAASNVTSQKTDLTKVNNLIKIHKLNLSPEIKFYFAVDAAAYCSHGRLDLNQQLDQLDYLCLSPHKNLGGTESTGVLLGKKSSYDNQQPPSFPGGGTVLAVVGTDLNNIFYDTEPSHREMPGTPNTIGFYRAALSFQLQDYITLQLIDEREKKNAKYFIEQIIKFNSFLQSNDQLKNRGIEIYGENNFDKRFGVFSFNIYCPQKKNQENMFKECFMVDPNNNESFLHPHFGAKLLNDIFAIQVRSGCSCAGPFGVKLLDIPQKVADDIAMKVALEGQENKKPGWIRLDTNFIFEQYEIDYILQALFIITLNAENLSPFYNQNFNNGQFNLKCGFKPKYKFGMSNILDNQQHIEYQHQERKQLLKKQIQFAKQLFQDPNEYIYKSKIQQIKSHQDNVHQIQIKKQNNLIEKKVHDDEDDGFQSIDEEDQQSQMTQLLKNNKESKESSDDQKKYSNELTEKKQSQLQQNNNISKEIYQNETDNIYFQYNDLCKQYIDPKIYQQIDLQKKETYLNDEEFFSIFKMSKQQFQQLQNNEKYELKKIYSLL